MRLDCFMSGKRRIENGKFRRQSLVHRLLLTLCFLFAVYCLPTTISAQSDGSQQNVTGRAGTFVIQNARIVTVSGSTIERGSILIREGKIEALGAAISIPKGAELIDGKGLSVYPGMIDAGTKLGLAEIPLGANATMDVAEVGDNNANAKAISGINPHSSHVNVTRVNGITTVLTFPNGGMIAGQSAVVNLNGSTQAEMSLVPIFGLVLNFPRISTQQGFNPAIGPQTIEFNEAVKLRDKKIEELKTIFADAQNYARVKDAFAKDKTLPRPIFDLKLEALLAYTNGEKPVMFLVERERDIRAALKFADDLKLRAVILGGQDAWKVADLLKQKNVDVIYTNIYDLPVQQDDPYDNLFEAPSKLQKAGVRFCISTGNDGAEVRDLPYHAGIAGAFGLSKEEALKSVTLYPAQILGIADKVGSLEVGKIANVVVTDGDILDPRTNIKFLFINGKILPLTSRHTELYERFKDRKIPN